MPKSRVTRNMIHRRIMQSPQSGRNTPNEGFFDSKHFAELDHIQRRVQRLSEEASEREEKLSAQRRRIEEERRLRGATDRKPKDDSEEREPCEFCVRAASRSARKDEAAAFKYLRRPLPPRCTCMDPTDGGLPVLRIEYPVDIDDWAYKPFSTIASGGALGYRNHFPLLMQRCTEAEEKDGTQVQTETRRHSVVTTDYLTGRIKLEGTGGEDVHMAVFPVLHVVVSSDEDEDDDDDIFSSGNDDGNDDANPDALRALRAEHTMSVPRRPSIKLAAAQQRRRSSLTPRGFPGYPGGGATSRVIRRRSIDHGSLALSFARALEAASEAMTPISEDQEGRSETPDTGFDVKHAEETMVHMAQNLETLEEFLKGASSASSISDASSSDDDDA